MARYRSAQSQVNLFTLLFGLARVIGSIVLVGWNFRWARSALAGPVPMTVGELARIEGPNTLPNPYVTIRLDGARATGLGISSKSKSGTITEKSHYLLLPVEGRYLIVEVPAKHSSGEATGYLDEWGTPLRREAIGKIEGKFPEYRGKFLPYQFDGEYSYRGQCWAMLGIAAFGIVCGVALVGAWTAAAIKKPKPAREVEDDI